MAEEWKLKTTCEYYGNPTSDTYSFDNIMLSIMNIFEMITLEGWTDMMYIVRDAEQTLIYDLFFIMCVIVGNFIILNLMVAVQSAYLDKAFDEEDARKQEIQDKIEAKKKLKAEIEEAQEYDDEIESEEEMDPDEFEDESDDGKGGRRGTRKKQVKKGICDIKKPDWLVKSSNKVEEFCETPVFERTIIGLILLNTLSLASEHYEEDAAVTNVNVGANLFFTVIFAVEMVLKLFGFGCKKYVADNFNNFDAFIVVMSYVELVVPQDESGEGGGGLGMLRAFRLLRIFKIIKSWESLKVLLTTVFDSLQAITNLGVLILLFLFIFALLCKQFFSEPLLDDGGEVSRYSFGDTYTALVTMFIILTGENWNEVMILVISNMKSFTPAYLFIFMMLLGNFMLLNLFLAILLKSISDIGDDEDDGEIDPANNEDEEADAQNALGGLNESAPLNSSNSNIEEEFEQIKN
jgi:voltage-dependent calcium channel L type alpha-1D